MCATHRILDHWDMWSSRNLNEDETEDQGIAVVKVAVNGNSRTTRYAAP